MFCTSRFLPISLINNNDWTDELYCSVDQNVAIVQLRMSLHSYLRESYGQPTQSLVKRFEKDLHKRARYANPHIYSLRCKDEGVISPSLRIKPPISKTVGSFSICVSVCVFKALD